MTCSYLPVGEEAVADVGKLVAPGGALLWVHHDFGDDGPGARRGTARAGSTEFTVTGLGKAVREVSHGAGAHHREDIVLVAVRVR